MYSVQQLEFGKRPHGFSEDEPAAKGVRRDRVANPGFADAEKTVLSSDDMLGHILQFLYTPVLKGNDLKEVLLRDLQNLTPNYPQQTPFKLICKQWQRVISHTCTPKKPKLEDFASRIDQHSLLPHFFPCIDTLVVYETSNAILPRIAENFGLLRSFKMSFTFPYATDNRYYTVLRQLPQVCQKLEELTIIIRYEPHEDCDICKILDDDVIPVIQNIQRLRKLKLVGYDCTDKTLNTLVQFQAKSLESFAVSKECSFSKLAFTKFLETFPGKFFLENEPVKSYEDYFKLQPWGPISQHRLHFI